MLNDLHPEHRFIHYHFYTIHYTLLMFFEFGIKDVIDIFLVALMLYYIYRLMKIVLFKEEIRKFLYQLGAHQRVKSVMRFFSQRKDNGQDEDKETIMPIVWACMDMAKKKVGALIVIERATPLDDIVQTGEQIDARVNKLLIENIFFKNSPLHDGAMIVSKKRIKAAGCILPVSHNMDIPKELGLRHRAAMGISQDSDAIAVVVSEETGRISVAIKGQFHLRLSAEELESILAREMIG